MAAGRRDQGGGGHLLSHRSGGRAQGIHDAHTAAGGVAGDSWDVVRIVQTMSGQLSWSHLASSLQPELLRP